MHELSLIPVAFLYSFSMLGDGCILVAIAVAATMGGKPWMWGLSFGCAHALYSLLGVAVISEIAEYSESFGDLLVFLGSVVLLRHFLHHRFHQHHEEECTCEIRQQDAKPATIFTTAAGLSFHALASGAVLRQMAGAIPASSVVVILLCVSAMVGTLVFGIVYLGETEHIRITRFLDKIPGVMTALLIALCGACLHHLLEHAADLSNGLNTVFAIILAITAMAGGYVIHEKSARLANSHPNDPATSVVNISSRKI